MSLVTVQATKLKTRQFLTDTSYASRTHHSLVQPMVPIYYRIRIDRISGRRVTPSPDGPIKPRTPPLLVRVFHAIFKPFAGRRK